MSAVVDRLAVPVVQAPMAGGPGTPALAAAVSDAGGLGFLAAAYVPPDALGEQIAATRALTGRAFGVNLFVPSAAAADRAAIARYVEDLAPLAREHGVAFGDPVHDDDGFSAKIDALIEARPAVVSFTFGLPSEATVERLHAVGIEVWITTTDADEARAAIGAGADAIVVQGAEAGGHQGSFTDHDRPRHPLADLLAAIAPDSPVPVVAAGGLMDGTDVRRVLGAGAAAAQLGTAFLLCPEAGTAPVVRAALTLGRTTVLTRAFTGRLARSIVNDWTTAYPAVPSAYPEIHHLTAPLRARGRSLADPELVNLWAGTNHAGARAVPAADLVAALGAEPEP